MRVPNLKKKELYESEGLNNFTIYILRRNPNKINPNNKDLSLLYLAPLYILKLLKDTTYLLLLTKLPLQYLLAFDEMRIY